jgi:LysR family transcriptional regulator, regulator for metE and metH
MNCAHVKSWLTAMLEIRHLKSLIAIADCGSLSRAAGRIHLTQSALSHQLRALEDHYHVRLIDRGTRAVTLTRAGERMVAAARAVIEQIHSAERDVARLAHKPAGTLRIALECHTCFDWLLPIMHVFRKEWPEVQLDLVSGFHPSPLELLADGEADVIIGSPQKRRRGVAWHPLFRFEVLAVLPTDHRLRAKRYLAAEDFADETLITYPVPDDRIDLIRHVLKPAGVKPRRRTTELTLAILQLVASHQGVAALPSWGVASYVNREQVLGRRIGKTGLWSDLYAATTTAMAKQPYLEDFLETARRECFANLQSIVPLTD